MKDGARIAAAIEILDTLTRQHQPMKDAVRDWGKAHRFAGSGDRAWIGGLVLDALRHQASVGYAMGEGTARALALGTVGRVWGLSADEIDALFEGDEHAPEPLTEAERAVRGSNPRSVHSGARRDQVTHNHADVAGIGGRLERKAGVQAH